MTLISSKVEMMPFASQGVYEEWAGIKTTNGTQFFLDTEWTYMGIAAIPAPTTWICQWKPLFPPFKKKKKKVQGRENLQVAEMKRESKGPNTARPMEVAGLDVS